MTKEELIQEIKRSISYKEFDNQGDYLFIILDRFRRHDHGGGPDGDDWLEDHEIEHDFDEGFKKHRGKLEKVRSIIESSGIKADAEFDLGEKGHFSLIVNFY